MQTTEALYRYARSRGHAVYRRPLRHTRAMSVRMPDGRCAIAISKLPLSVRLERRCLAHELGHCETGAFYTYRAQAAEITRCELRAERWAICFLIPYDDLCRQIAAGLQVPHALAEHFEVPEAMVLDAIAYYKAIGLTVPAPTPSPSATQP